MHFKSVLVLHKVVVTTIFYLELRLNFDKIQNWRMT